MDFHLDCLLNFPNVTVLSCQQQEGFVILKLNLLNEGIACPHCQNYTDVKMGIRKLTKWLNSARIFFRKTAETIAGHLQEICHNFINRTTSGVMEGLNNPIQLILRQSYGFKNFDMMREKLLACLFK